MDEEQGIDTGTGQTVGERLREARLAKKLEIEDVASVTRIPTRHLANLEDSNWAELPAPTYTLGFAKSYAAHIGLDREEIGEQLKQEMGGWDSPVLATQAEYYEPSDPKRAMPKGLVIGAILALVVLALLLNWLSNREPDSPQPVAVEEQTPSVALPADSPLEQDVADGPVVLTATDRVWLRIKDGDRTLKDGEMAAGESFTIPTDAVNPTLVTGRAEALQIKVGDKTVAQVGPSSVRVENVSLKGESLLALAEQPVAQPAPVRIPTPAPSRPAPRRTTPAPAPAESTPAAATQTPSTSTDGAAAQ